MLTVTLALQKVHAAVALAAAHRFGSCDYKHRHPNAYLQKVAASIRPSSGSNGLHWNSRDTQLTKTFWGSNRYARCAIGIELFQ